MTDPDLAGWRRLGCAILLLAYRDAHEGNGHSQDARRFLAGDGARRLVAWLELDAGGLAVALQDLPPPAYEQLALPLGGPPSTGAAGPQLAGVTPAVVLLASSPATEPKAPWGQDAGGARPRWAPGAYLVHNAGKRRQAPARVGA